MIKKIAFSIILALSFTLVLGQGGSLKFSQVLKVNNTSQTVPANHVWKITGIYGSASTSCWNVDCSSCWGSSTYIVGRTKGFSIDGVTAFTDIEVIDGYTNNPGSCSPTNTSCGGNCGYPRGIPTKDSFSPFPVWMAAGSTLQTTNASVFVSVIEFEIIP